MSVHFIAIRSQEEERLSAAKVSLRIFPGSMEGRCLPAFNAAPFDRWVIVLPDSCIFYLPGPKTLLQVLHFEILNWPQPQSSYKAGDRAFNLNL